MWNVCESVRSYLFFFFYKSSPSTVHVSGSSPVAQAWDLAMFGNNRFFAFCISSRGTGVILPGWELASGLAFSESKMAALKSTFLNNSRSKGNILTNHVSTMHYLVVKSTIMTILEHFVSPGYVIPRWPPPI